MSQEAEHAIAMVAHLVRAEVAPPAGPPSPVEPMGSTISHLTGSKRLRVSLAPQQLAEEAADETSAGVAVAAGTGGLTAAPLYEELCSEVAQIDVAVKGLINEMQEQAAMGPGLLPSDVLVMHCEGAGLSPPARLTDASIDGFLVDAAQRMLDLGEQLLEVRAPEPTGPFDIKYHRFATRPADPAQWNYFPLGTKSYEMVEAGTVAGGELKPIRPNPTTLISLEGQAPSVVQVSVERDLVRYPAQMKSTYSAARTAAGLRKFVSLVPAPPSPAASAGRLGDKVERLVKLVSRMSVAACAPPPSGYGPSSSSAAGSSSSASQLPPLVPAGGLVVRAHALRAAMAPPLDRTPQAVLPPFPGAVPAARARGTFGEGMATPGIFDEERGVTAAAPTTAPTAGEDVSWADVEHLSLDEMVNLLFSD